MYIIPASPLFPSILYLGLHLSTMKSSLFFLLASSALPYAVFSAPFGYNQVNGVTQLIGSSFGVLGRDATFDYVVNHVRTSILYRT